MCLPLRLRSKISSGCSIGCSWRLLFGSSEPPSVYRLRGLSRNTLLLARIGARTRESSTRRSSGRKTYLSKRRKRNGLVSAPRSLCRRRSSAASFAAFAQALAPRGDVKQRETGRQRWIWSLNLLRRMSRRSFEPRVRPFLASRALAGPLRGAKCEAVPRQLWGCSARVASERGALR